MHRMVLVSKKNGNQKGGPRRGWRDMLPGHAVLAIKWNGRRKKETKKTMITSSWLSECIGSIAAGKALDSYKRRKPPPPLFFFAFSYYLFFFHELFSSSSSFISFSFAKLSFHFSLASLQAVFPLYYQLLRRNYFFFFFPFCSHYLLHSCFPLSFL